MNVMNARRVLSETGYIVLYNAADDNFINNLRSSARHANLNWTNGTWNGEAFDPLRVRARLPVAICRELELKFRRHYMTFFEHASATEWSLLKTMAGSLDTPVRRDFPPPLPDVHAAELSKLPAILLVATQDDTFLYGYGWNRIVALRSNVEMIKLNKGDMIMLRGDFVHALAGYETNKLMLHAYLDTPHYRREVEGSEPHLVAVVDDEADVDDNPFCFVYNCPFVASSTTSLRKHMNRFHKFHFGQPRG